MNLYELFSLFWRDNGYRAFSKTETILYFYLLNMANSARWQMPFTGYTERISADLQTTKQNIVKARAGLQQRGLISFTAGTGKENPPLYTIIDRTSQLSVPLSENLSVKMSVPLSPINIKDKNRNNNIHNVSNGKLELDELEMILANDAAWLNSVILQRGSDIDRETVLEYLKMFIAEQKMKSSDKREIIDIQKHFRNWLNIKMNYRLKHERAESKRVNSGRRATEITATSPEDYDSEKFGLFFSGMCGNGKTTWLKAIRTLINSLNLRHPQTNSSYSVSLWNARELAYRCKDEYQEWARIARLPILAIDDFGTDPKEIISFGNCLTPMIDLITKRYEEQLFTLFTTNLTFSQIKEKYEERIADRLIEMVVPIRFGNGSYRS